MTAQGLVLAVFIVCLFVVAFAEFYPNGAAKKAKRGKVKPKGNQTKKAQNATLIKSASKDPEQFEAAGGRDLPEVLAAAAKVAAEKGHPVKVAFNRAPGGKQYRVFPGGYFELTN